MIVIHKRNRKSFVMALNHHPIIGMESTYLRHSYDYLIIVPWTNHDHYYPDLDGSQPVLMYCPLVTCEYIVVIN